MYHTRSHILICYTSISFNLDGSEYTLIWYLFYMKYVNNWHNSHMTVKNADHTIK
jgi:hypothetical protein